MTSGGSGNGNGAVAFSATANPNGTPRSGTLTIGGQTFTVNQAAVGCTYALSSTNQSVVAAGGTGSTNVTAPTGCAWTGVSNATSWLSVTSGGSGNGNGTVAFSATANPNGTPRSGTLTIGGQTFTVNQAAVGCTYALSSTTQSVVAAGGTGSTNVTAPTGCGWTGVSSDPSWLTVTSGATGSGNGAVAFSATANPNGTARSGTLTIGGQTFTVNQTGVPCSYSLSPTNQSVVAGGGTGSTNVTAPTGCGWTGVSSDPSWLTVTSGATGSGNGAVAFNATANPNGTPRSGSLTIGGQTFTINQAGVPCTYSLSPTNQSVVAGGGAGSTSVTAPNGCAWTGVSNDTSWLTVTSGAIGNGNGTVAFSATANPNGTPRGGSLTIGGQTFTVNQVGVTCSYSLSPAGQSVVAAGGTGSTSVTAPNGCAWTGVSNHTSWLTLTSGASGNGNGTVAFSATANPNGTPRSGTLTIGGQTFTVTQAAVACTYALLPASQSVVAGGATGSTSVTAPTGCAWTGVSNDTSWLTVTSGATGSGNGTVAFSATANPNASQRGGTLTIGGQTFTVTQAAAPCTFSVSPTNPAIIASAASGSTGVTAPAGCAWTAVSNSTAWLTVTSGATGSGNGSVGFSATGNVSATPRVGSLTVAGQTVTVTQAGVGCTFTISSNSLSVPAAGGAGSTNVTSPAGCPWSAAANDNWITVTSGASSSGNGSAGFSVAANPNASARTGTLTIASQTFTVTQAAAACTFTLTPASQSVVASGGTGSTSVATPTGCAWTAVSNATAWLSVSAGASGNGNGTVIFAAAANPAPQTRSGTVTIGGQAFTVNQAAASCDVTLSSTVQAVASTGGTGSTNVTVLTGCTWTAVSNNTSWLTVTGGSSGNGNGTVTFSAAANTLTQQRTGTITIAGQTFTLNQDPAGCAFSISPTSQSVASSGGNGSATVTTTTGCNWTASSGVAWITITAGGTGSGAGSTSFTTAPNTSASARTGALTIAGRLFTVTQAPNTCSYSLTPASRTHIGAGGSGTITVGTASGCNWTASTGQSWITVSGSGTASGSASYTVQANTTGSNRTGAISIGTQVFTVIQNTGGGTTTPVAPAGLRIVVTGGSE